MTPNYASLGMKLYLQGFEPIPVNGKRPVVKGWQDLTLHRDQIEIWAENGKGDLNVGIRTANLAPIDIDIYDAEVAAKVADAFQARFGKAPMRIGEPPKRLLLYRADKPGPKITSVLFTTPDRLEHRVEVLGVGQQFVAYGIHPDCRRPYEWFGEELSDLELWQLPVLDRDEVAAWVKGDLVGLMMENGFRPRYELEKKGADAPGAPGASDAPPWDADDPFSQFKQRHDDVDLDGLRFLLDNLDQDKCDDRETWRNTIFAVHHQFHGTEAELDALELVDQWSAKSAKYTPGLVPKMWEDAHEQRGGGLVTIGTLKTWVGDKWTAYRTRHKAVAAVAAVEEQSWETRIAAADLATLEGTLAPEIKAADLTPGARGVLVTAVRNRFRALGSSVTMPQIRQMLEPAREARPAETLEVAPDIDDWTSTAPAWAKAWVWIRGEGKWLNRRTKIKVTKSGFDTEMQKHVTDLHIGDGDDAVVYEASTRMFQHWGAKTADKEGFHPAMPEIFEFNGLTFYNKYRPELRLEPAAAWTVEGRQMARALERHMSLLFPNRRERQLVRAWLAHNYLHPGFKIRWALLIKGCPGDGKSLFGELLELALGADNVRLMNADTVQSSDFSGWVEGQCVTVFEEVKFHGHNRHDVVNKLKPYLTNNRVEKHSKGQDPGNVINVTNYLLLTNHEDAIPIEIGDRRYFVVFSPFKKLEDLDSALMADYCMTVAEHFTEIFDLVRANPGQLALWLSETEFPAEWDPNMSAPMTEAKASMVVASKSDTDTMVDDVLEDAGDGHKTFGVTPTLFSLFHLKRAMRLRGLTQDLPDRMLAGLLRRKGFEPAPSSEKGKALKLRWQGERVRVWVKEGHSVTADAARQILDGTMGGETGEAFDD